MLNFHIRLWWIFIYIFPDKKSELGTRAAIFCSFGHLGSMTGAWIQAGLITSLNGKAGLPAWRWIFVIVSVITIPVALFGECLSTHILLLLMITGRMGIHSQPSSSP